MRMSEGKITDDNSYWCPIGLPEPLDKCAKQDDLTGLVAPQDNLNRFNPPIVRSTAPLPDPKKLI